MKLRQINIDDIIDLILCLYILSLYIFSNRENLFVISNMLTFLFVGLVIVKMLKKREVRFNSFLIWNIVFIVFAFFSSVYALKINNVFAEVRTITLLYIVMLAVVNYVDSFCKVSKIINFFVFAGVVTSTYILISSDLSTIQRFGGELGNVNDIGMMIGLSSVFSLSNYMKYKRKLWMFSLIPMMTVVFLTGSRKSILFVAFASLLITYLSNRVNLKGKIKFIMIGSLIIVSLSYIMFYIPLFYNIIGIRLEGLINLFSDEGVVDKSTLIREEMINFGFELFFRRPFLGYGADNYRIMYSVFYGSASYSHNNFIELLVNLGIIGALLYYVPQFIVIRKLSIKSRNIKYFDERVVMITLMSIILVYFGLGVSLVYYKNKQFSIIIALASSIVQIYRKKEHNK